MKRRLAKKRHKAEVLARRAAIGDARPVPPARTGQLLIPAGYTGWVLITTPGGRQKVRFVAPSGRVFRDSHCWHGGGYHVALHAAFCRVEPVAIVSGMHQWQGDFLSRVLAHPAIPATGTTTTAVVTR